MVGYLSDKTKLTLRVIYDWSYVGRTQILADPPTRFPHACDVPESWLRAELHGQILDVSAALRILFDKEMIESYYNEPLQDAHEALNSSWELPDGRIMRVVTINTVKELEQPVTFFEQSRSGKETETVCHSWYKCDITVDDDFVGGSEGLSRPNGKRIRLTKSGIVAAESLIQDSFTKTTGIGRRIITCLISAAKSAWKWVFGIIAGLITTILGAWLMGLFKIK